MLCSVPVVPHAPCNSYNEFKYVLAHMLPEDEVPNQVDEVTIVYTHIIERNTGGSPNFLCMSAVPKEMPTGLSSQATCIASRVVEHSARAEVRLGGENIPACSPGEGFQQNTANLYRAHDENRETVDCGLC